MIAAPVNKIIPFSFVDGAGNRTAIFLQGCNQNCLYCHNPETIRLCVACGDCVGVCPGAVLSLAEGRVAYDIDRCRQCDACLRACAHCSSPKVRNMTAGEAFEHLRFNVPFIDGVTVSGGECTLYIPFLTELFRLVKRAGLTAFIDTNGQIPLWEHPELLDLTDRTMIDLKAGDDAEHRRLTGRGIANVVRNIREMARMDKLHEIRTVVAPGVMDPLRAIRLGSELIAPWPEVRYKLIRYRPFGVREGLMQSAVPDDALMDTLAREAAAMGVSAVEIV